MAIDDKLSVRWEVMPRMATFEACLKEAVRQLEDDREDLPVVLAKIENEVVKVLVASHGNELEVVDMLERNFFEPVSNYFAIDQIANKHLRMSLGRIIISLCEKIQGK